MNSKETEFKGWVMSGFVMLFIQLLMVAGGIYATYLSIVNEQVMPYVPILAVGFVLWIILCCGYMMLEPNEAIVMVFFGTYKGTFKGTGFFWTNPFITQKKLSLRARNLDVKPIKVNDKIGNPIMIGLVLVWKLNETYKAMFEIDSQTLAENGGVNTNALANRMKAFENFVKVQSDAALRQVAGQYAYDDNEAETNEQTLRSGGDVVNEQLVKQLNERLAMAGIIVDEARINYLAYAPEIAAVMLRRQQASAIISAREKIVEGAVSMVKMALHKLSDEQIVDLTEEKKAQMVSNLLVVLCADEAAQPVVNTGGNNE